jgi:hypothetical protein
LQDDTIGMDMDIKPTGMGLTSLLSQNFTKVLVLLQPPLPPLLAGGHHWHAHQADRHPVHKPAVTLISLEPTFSNGLQDGTIGMDIKLTGILSTSLLSHCFRKVITLLLIYSCCLQDGTIGMDIKLTGILPTSLLSHCLLSKPHRF